jgi:uncharacterized Zn-binding protein involved in type VI secretion
MGTPAARLGDFVMHDAPHCHAPIHPPAPVPTPMAHPPQPIAILGGCRTVLIAGMQAARMTDTTAPCQPPTCVPGGPGVIVRGSMTVLIGNLPAARIGDTVSFAGCVGPIPCPTGKVFPPGCPTVLIGG